MIAIFGNQLDGCGLSLGASQDVWAAMMRERDRYNMVVARWKKHPLLAAWLDLAWPDSITVPTAPGYPNNTEVQAIGTAWRHRWARAIEIEDALLDRYSFNPAILSDAERDSALTKIETNLSAGGTIPASSPVNPLVPAAGKLPVGVPGAAPLPGAKPAGTTTAAGGIVGYLPYVAVGIAAFKLFL